MIAGITGLSFMLNFFNTKFWCVSFFYQILEICHTFEIVTVVIFPVSVKEMGVYTYFSQHLLSD